MVKLCSPPVYTRSSQPSAQGEIWESAPDEDKQKHATLKSRKKVEKNEREFEKKKMRDYLLICGLAELKDLASGIVTYRLKNIRLKLLPLQEHYSKLSSSKALHWLCVVWWERNACGTSDAGGHLSSLLPEWETPAPQKGNPNNPSSLLLDTRPLKEGLPQVNHYSCQNKTEKKEEDM